MGRLLLSIATICVLLLAGCAARSRLEVVCYGNAEKQGVADRACNRAAEAVLNDLGMRDDIERLDATQISVSRLGGIDPDRFVEGIVRTRGAWVVSVGLPSAA